MTNALDRLAAERAAESTGQDSGFVLPARVSPMQEMLTRLGLTQDQLRDQIKDQDEAGRLKKRKRPTSVPDTNELRRIAFLPRRSQLTGDSAAQLTAQYTQSLRRVGGRQELRTIQAIALHELRLLGGLFAMIRVGGGKTLITWLAPTICNARRPLVIVPAALVSKTRRDFKLYAQHWIGPDPDSVRVESYEYISMSGGVQLDDKGRQISPGFLSTYQPDLLIMDEVQKVFSHSAAVTARFKRYMRDYPGTKVVALTGTITKRSLRDYAHILHWCLPRYCPLPMLWEHVKDEENDYGRQNTLDLWADALDEKVSEMRRLAPGALVRLASEEAQKLVSYGAAAEIIVARKAYQSRLVETPGVISSEDSELPVGIKIREWAPDSRDSNLDQHFRQLRDKGVTPAGLVCPDPMAIWRCARELGLGFFYRWNPPGPEDWMAARRDWAVWCRELLKTNKRGLETEAQMASAVEREIYPGKPILDAWRALRPTFEPETEAVWVSTEALDAAHRWALEGPGIIWVEHVEFALVLAKRTGLSYYGRGGLDQNDRMIEDHDPSLPCIAGIQANHYGRNLQAWNRNLIMATPTTGLMWEQLMGRTHRDGQTRDVVVDVWLGCREHAAGYWQALADSQYVCDTTGQRYKILFAESKIDPMQEVEDRTGARWEPNNSS